MIDHVTLPSDSQIQYRAGWSRQKYTTAKKQDSRFEYPGALFPCNNSWTFEIRARYPILQFCLGCIQNPRNFSKTSILVLTFTVQRTGWHAASYKVGRHRQESSRSKANCLPHLLRRPGSVPTQCRKPVLQDTSKKLPHN